MANLIQAGALLTAGLRSEFSKVYYPSFDGIKEQLGDVMWLGVTSNKLTELYAYLESTPFPVRWDRGNVIGSKNMKSVQFSVTNRDFGRRIYFHVNDLADDQTSSLYAQARALGQNWATLAERIFFQILGALTDNDLLPAVPNAADGSALYISTTRFGSSDGNIVSQTGSSTAQQIITDLMSAQRRFIEFQDTEGQPLWNAGDVSKGMVMFYGPSIILPVTQAMTSMSVHSTIAGSSTTNVQTGARIDNVLKTGGIDIKPVVSQRISDSKLYLFLKGLPDYKKPIFQQVREPFFEAQGNWETSDHVRDTGEMYIQFRSREGYGIPVPFATIRVS
jgi:hypothetical protein